jgi:hypothetical protein
VVVAAAVTPDDPERMGCTRSVAPVCRRDAYVDWIACGIVGNGARDLVFRGSVCSVGAMEIGGIVGAGWYARGWMCGTAAGVGVTGVADAGARLLLFARRLRREAVRGGGVEDVDQLAMFFW